MFLAELRWRCGWSQRGPSWRRYSFLDPSPPLTLWPMVSVGDVGIGCPFSCCYRNRWHHTYPLCLCCILCQGGLKMSLYGCFFDISLLSSYDFFLFCQLEYHFLSLSFLLSSILTLYFELSCLQQNSPIWKQAGKDPHPLWPQFISTGANKWESHV